MFDTFVNILSHNLGEPAYEADVAQLEYKLVAGEHGLVIRVKGFNHKLPVSTADLLNTPMHAAFQCMCLLSWQLEPSCMELCMFRWVILNLKICVSVQIQDHAANAFSCGYVCKDVVLFT